MQHRLKMTVIHVQLNCTDRYSKWIADNKKDNFVPNVGDWAFVTVSIKRLNILLSGSPVPKSLCPPLHTYTWLLKRWFMNTIRARLQWYCLRSYVIVFGNVLKYTFFSLIINTITALFCMFISACHSCALAPLCLSASTNVRLVFPTRSCISAFLYLFFFPSVHNPLTDPVASEPNFSCC